MQDQREIEDLRMHAESALDLGQTLVALDGLHTRQVSDAGAQHERRQALGIEDRGLVRYVAESVGLVVSRTKRVSSASATARGKRE